MTSLFFVGPVILDIACVFLYGCFCFPFGLMHFFIICIFIMVAILL
jgi:hypothetical protein